MTDMGLLGLFTVLIAAIGWGTYLVPLKKLKKPDLFLYHAFMSIAILLFASVLVSFFQFPFSLNLYGVLGGFFWAVGNVLSIKAIRSIGLAKAAAIWIGFVILTPFLWGVIFFREPLTSLAFGIIGILLLIGGVLSISLEKGGKLNFKSIFIAALAGILFGTQYTPFKLSGLVAEEFIFPMSIGIFITGLPIFLIKLRRIDTKGLKNGLVSGTIWSIANISALYAVSFLGLAIGFPLTQLSILVATSWGLFYFKEVKERSKIVRIIFGAIIILMGVVFLAFAR